MSGLKTCRRFRAMMQRRSRRISSSLLPENIGPQIASIQPSLLSPKLIEEVAKRGGPGPRPTPPSATVLSVLEEPDQGPGADAGVRPTKKYVTNHWGRRRDYQ